MPDMDLNPPKTGHSPFQQRVLWTALNTYRTSQKLTWVSLAHKLQADTGVTFYDTYFRRLKKGELRNESASTVYDWFVDSINPQFSYPQPTHNYEQSDEHDELVRWKKISPDLTKNLFKSFNSSILIPDINFDNTAISVCQPTFLDSPLYRICEYTTLPQFVQYFSKIDDTTYGLLDGFPGPDNFVEWENVNEGNIAALLNLFHEIDGSESLLCLDILDATQALEYEEIDIYKPYFTNHTYKKLGDPKDIEIEFECDVFKGRKAYRRHYSIKKASINYVDRACIYSFTSFPAFKPFKNGSRLLTPNRLSECQETKFRERIIDIVSAVRTGFGLLTMIDPSIIDDSTFEPYSFKVLSGVTYGWHLSHPLRQLTLFYTSNTKEVTAKIAIDLIYYLRMIEQEVLGFTLPPANESMYEYACVAHAKNLDATLFICHFYIDVEDSNEWMDYLRDEYDSRGLHPLISALKRGASGEELSDIYHSEQY